jgi:glutamate racemase
LGVHITLYFIIKLKKLGKEVKIISQNKLIPAKLNTYLLKHTEIEKVLAKKKHYQFNVTDLTKVMEKTVRKWFGKNVVLHQVDLRN